MPLLASLFGDVDDVAEVERELRVGGALFDALEALRADGETSQGRNTLQGQGLRGVLVSVLRREWFSKHQV